MTKFIGKVNVNVVKRIEKTLSEQVVATKKVPALCRNLFNYYDIRLKYETNTDKLTGSSWVQSIILVRQ